MKKAILSLSIISLSPLLVGCSILSKGEAKYPTGEDRAISEQSGLYEETPTIWGKNRSLLNPNGKDNKGEGLTVNSFLWRAALDTISFMPLVTADPFGGTIITDWYTDASTPNERIKLNVFIIGNELKASAIKVTVFKQVDGIDSQGSQETKRKLEDAILTRARQLRIAQIEQDK